MMNISVNIEKTLAFLKPGDLEKLQPEINLHYNLLVNRKGVGNEFLGWLDLPDNMMDETIERINIDSKIIISQSEVVVIVGIGGSYLGAKALIEALGNHFRSFYKGEFPQIVYAGQNINGEYHAELLEMLDNKDYSIVVISKSGSTTEPAIAFRLLKTHLENKYGKEHAGKRIIAVTDAEKGALKQLADMESYSTYVIPDNVGGRYSVLTPVGLLPVAVAGFNIRELLRGAAEMKEHVFASSLISENIALLYAAARTALYRAGKPIEIMVSYTPSLMFLTEWWKQLFGESEGKQNRGIFPAGNVFTTDLHSMGQYIQEGLRVLFETVISIDKPGKDITIPFDISDADGLNYIAGKSMNEVNHTAELGTALAHVDGGVPNIRIGLPEINERNLGQLIYFFEFSCAISGYLLGVNPFDQPGVEAYKKNMFALLGKKGFEKEGEELKKRL